MKLFFYIGRTLAKDLKVEQDMNRRKTGREMAVIQPHTLRQGSDQASGADHGCDDDQASDESSEDEEALMSYQEDSISTIILENARLMIDRLYKLSFKIRDPATRLGYSKVRTYRAIDEETGADLMQWYASFDLRHVAEIMARYWRTSPEECEKYDLVQRLARANTNRRRQFGSWRRHKLKLESVEKVYAQTMEDETNVEAASTLLNVSQGPENDTFSLPSTATRLDENNIKFDDTVSDSTSTISFTEDDKNNTDIPPLPGTLCTGKDFECPFCHILCSKRVSNQTAWE